MVNPVGADTEVETVWRTHKIRLDPNNKQATVLRQYMGASRFIYNQTKALAEVHYKETGKGLSKFALRDKVVAEVKQAPENSWLYQIPKGVTSYAVFNYHDALSRFFKGQNRYPQYKKRKAGSGSFSVENDRVTVEGRKIRLPLLGWVRMREVLRFEGKIKAVTVSLLNDQYHVSLLVETIPPQVKATGAVVGIDLNLAEVVDSDNGRHSQPRAYRRHNRTLSRLHKSYSRKKKESKNQEKARLRLAHKHARTAAIRADHNHKLTHYYATNYDLCGIETLGVSSMSRNSKLAKHIMDAGFSHFRTLLTYKTKMYGKQLVLADRFYPSSKTCSACGSVKTKLTLSERIYSCETCGMSLDRDYNAALNLCALAVGFTERLNACGGVSDLSTRMSGQAPPEKQEPTNLAPARDERRKAVVGSDPEE